MNSIDPLVLLFDYIGYFWLLVSIAFLFAELSTPGLFFFVSFSLGAFCAAILAFIGYSLVIQCIGGLAVSIVSFFILRKYLKQKRLSDVHYSSSESETNIYGIVGKEGVVTDVIEPLKYGQVKIGGEFWRASSEGGAILEKGTVVKVLSVKGNAVVVSVVSAKNNKD